MSNIDIKLMEEFEDDQLFTMGAHFVNQFTNSVYKHGSSSTMMQQVVLETTEVLVIEA